MLIVRSLLAPVLAAGTLALAACGSAGRPSASGQTGSGPGPGAVSFAKCMRGHGVPQFPDPGGPPNTNIKAPAFQSALNVCMKRFLAGHPRPPVTAAQKAAALRFSRCMRAHGVPGFPDPKFPGNRGIAIPEPTGAGASSPALLHAQQVCGNP